MKLEFLDVEKTSLEEWLALVFSPPNDKYFTNTCFPTQRHREEYLATIESRPSEEVCRLLEIFLVHSGTIPHDELTFRGYQSACIKEPERFNAMSQLHFYKRLGQHFLGERNVPPWEGLTWVMDLLPRYPERAAEAVFSYFLAHAWHIPDSQIYRLQHAEDVIRAKFIGLPKSHQHALNILLTSGSRNFECLIERLYFHMGYDTTLTSAKKDGGRDIICELTESGRKEKTLIECKLYTGKVGVVPIRALMGVVSDQKCNKGTVVTTNFFTKGAIDFADNNARIELIDGDKLIPMMNEFIGPRWPLWIDRLVDESNRTIPSNRKDKTFR